VGGSEILLSIVRSRWTIPSLTDRRFLVQRRPGGESSRVKQQTLLRASREPHHSCVLSAVVPILAPCGYPVDVDPNKFTLVTPLEKDQRKWMDSVCINIDDSRGRTRYRFTTSFESAAYGERAVAATFGALLHDYLRHPESKSLAPNGESCRRETVGLLQRAHIIGGKHRRIGKEVDRRWEEGDELDAIRQRPIEYQALRSKTGDATAIPGGALS
jgi:hypothetical protein